MSLLDRETQTAIAIRRELHQIPELLFDLPKTSTRVRQRLDEIGIQHVSGLAQGSGILAFLPASQKPAAGCIALRADMDALPIHEETGVEYASQTEGRMHACGHDGHTSILLGTAAVLAQSERPHHVLLIFQPAEEGGAGGRYMCDEGALDGTHFPARADMIYGLHGWPQASEGVLYTRPGPLMAATDSFHVVVHGKGGHAAYPHAGVDPIVVSAMIIQALQTIASRNVAPVDSVVLTVATINAGTAHNIIPDFCDFGGTLRTLRPETRGLAKTRLNEIAEGIAAGMGARVEIDWTDGYPAVENDEVVTQRLFDVLTPVFGADRVQIRPEPTMGGEDFSYYGHHVPACFYFLGLCPSGESFAGLHTSRFDFNDRVIKTGIEAMVALATAPPKQS